MSKAAYLIRCQIVNVKCIAISLVAPEAETLSGERRCKTLAPRAGRYLVAGIVSADVVLRDGAFRIAGRNGIRICRSRIRIAVLRRADIRGECAIQAHRCGILLRT